jgi:cobalamin biosynthesis protein CobT
MKESSDVSEQENEESEPKEKDDVENEKNDDEKTGDGTKKENKASEEKEKDSEESTEAFSKVINIKISIQNYCRIMTKINIFSFQDHLSLEIPTRDRSASVDDLKNEISVDSPKKNIHSGNIMSVVCRYFKRLMACCTIIKYRSEIALMQ